MARFSIKAAKAMIIANSQIAARAALEEYEILLVDEARKLAPVRQAFRNPKGQRHRTRALTGAYAYLDVGMKGRGSRMLIRRRDRSALNTRRMASGERFDYNLGRNVHKKDRFGEAPLSFKGRMATQIETVTSDKTLRGRKKSAIIKGYQFRNQELQNKLTPRARSDLARGIGVHRVGAGSASNAPAGSLIFGGALRDSIHGEDIVETKGQLTLSVTAGVRYAKYMEYGTYKDAAQPFLRPAIKNTRHKLRPIMKRHFQGTGFKVQG